jgi:two-component system sensor histidine kinase/response regulator
MKFLPRLFLFLFLPLAVCAKPRGKIDSLLHILPAQHDTIKIKTLIKLSQAYFGVSEDSAMLYARELLKEADKNGSAQRISEAYLIVGTCFRHQSKMDSALVYKHRALSVAEKAGYKKGVANACSDIGLYEKEYGRYDSAKIYSLRAIEIREELDDQRSLGTSYINLGFLFYDSKDLAQAMIYYRKAAANFLQQKKIVNYALALNNIAAVYSDRMEYDSALIMYNRTLVLRDSLGDKAGYSQSLLNIGVLYRDKMQYDKAEKYLLQAYQIKKTLGENREDLAICMFDLAQTYRFKKNYSKCQEYLDMAETIALPAHMKELERDICLEYSEMYSAQGKTELSLKYKKMYVQKRDSILDDERMKVLNDMQVKYETVKKEKENIVLKEKAKVLEIEKERDRIKLDRDENLRVALYTGIGILILFLGLAFYAYRVKIKSNKQITKQNKTLKELNKKLIESEEELTVLNRTKDKLFSVISHDISNPVKAIANYNQAILAREHELNREQLAEALRKVNQSVQPLQGFIDNLLHWSLLQRNGTSSNPEKFQSHEIAEEIISLYAPYATQKKVKLAAIIPSGQITSADKNMFRLVLRNLVSNAIKYSKEGDRVEISARTNGNKIRFEIKDEGSGMNPEKITSVLSGKQVASEKGTFAETGTGLGLTLVTEFLRMNNSELQIESLPGKGSVFSFELPSA